MLQLGSGSILGLNLSLPLLLCLLLLFELPLVLQSSIGLTVSAKLVNLAKLTHTLLVSSLKKLVQAPTVITAMR